MDTTKKLGKPSPRLRANPFSVLLFWWLNPLFWYGRKHDLKAKDLYNALPADLSEPLGNRLERFWNQELEKNRKTKRKPSLLRAIRRTFGWSYCHYGWHILFISLIFRTLQPYVLGLLIWHFDPRSASTTSDAYMFASGVIILALLQAMVGHHANLGQMEVGMRLRIACSSLIYRKIMRLSSASVSRITGGLVTNLLSNDVARFDPLFLFLHYFWVMPLQGAVIAYLIWESVGIASLAGVFLITLQTIPVQAYCGKLTSRLRSKVAIRTDERVRLMSEIISGIRVIKMYTWEKPFEHLVSIARRHEIDVLTITSYLRGINLASFVYTERTTLYFTVMAYVLQGYVISADKVFSMAQYFNMLQASMAIFFPRAITSAAEAHVSIQRIQKFLLLDESPCDTKPPLKHETLSISLISVTASWTENSIANTLHDINIQIPSKKLYALVGQVGAGKSSLLKVLLYELQALSGHVNVYGNVSYSSQEAWLFSGSVRQNILFGQPFDEEKYKSVTKACALNRDFEQLPFGDKTLVGDRGASLSGGQCARVNLARAVYRDADIYLLDDPLSAVDTHVGKQLFDNCINGYLKDKTRILVTHQIQYLGGADVIVLLSNGRVTSQGTFTDLKKKDLNFLNIAVTEETVKSPLEETNLAVSLETLTKDEEDEPKETEELVAKGKVSKSLYWKYFRAGGSYFMLGVLLCLFFIAQFSSSGCDYWVAYWIKQEEVRLRLNQTAFNETSNGTSQGNLEEPNYLDIDTALYIYGGFVLGSVTLSTLRNIVFYKICMNASKKLHNKMFASLLRAPVLFFDVNPAGRILNRFSKDTGAVDETLPMAMLESLQIFFVMFGIMTQVVIIHWWAIAPIAIMGFLYWKLRNVYIASAQDLKRLEGIAKSPVFSHTNSSLSGLLTIRSSQAQKMVCREFDSHQDSHTSAHFLLIATSSAFGFWLDIVSVAFVAVVTYSFVVFENENTFAGNVGLAISQSLILCGMLQYGMRQTAEMVAQMTSAERIFQYTDLEQEGPFESEPGQKPLSQWPSKGSLKFDQLYFRYSEASEPVLKNLQFNIKSGEKIGIVGRTGAGKSSLISAVFRLAKLDGSLFIDNIDVTKIGLGDLRKKISIIPQNPMLFSASLRYNLDPFKEYADADLWAALSDVELNRAFESLDHSVDHGGSNLSAGQRQLLCLARAIVKKNKILVLDEATANVDPATDALIQKTIRSKFADCTVLTIAHRLNTIMDSDKVMVMDYGELVEFDHPHLLLQKSNGYFAKMVQETGASMASHLKNISKVAYNAKIADQKVTEK